MSNNCECDEPLINVSNNGYTFDCPFDLTVQNNLKCANLAQVEFVTVQYESRLWMTERVVAAKTFESRKLCKSMGERFEALIDAEKCVEQYLRMNGFRVLVLFLGLDD